MDAEVKAKRPTYSDEFKRDAVRLVVEEGYSFKAACSAVGVCDATLRAWHRKLAAGGAAVRATVQLVWQCRARDTVDQSLERA